jgi:predicted CoA-binding protein
MASPNYSDRFLRQILWNTKSIAIVGVSRNEIRPSYFVARYLQLKGFKIIPVNPGFAGEQLLGETVRATLSDIPESVGKIDMVDIFRRSELVEPIVEEAIEQLVPRGLKTIWMQIGVEHTEAATRAEAVGLDVIMNKCPKMEYQRLIGELSMGGINTGIISSRLR